MALRVSRGAMCCCGRHRTAAMQGRPIEGDRRRVGNVEAVERTLGRDAIELVTTGARELAQASALRTEDEGDRPRPPGIVEGSLAVPSRPTTITPNCFSSSKARARFCTSATGTCSRAPDAALARAPSSGDYVAGS